MIDVSVIVPAYNPSRAGLFSAVASAFNQTAPPLEVIVCDDGSGISFMDDLKRKFPIQVRQKQLVIVRHEQNLGIAEARNTGVSHSSGSWLTWLDADDTIDGRCLEALASQAEGHQLVVGDCDLYERGQLVCRRKLSEVESVARECCGTSEDPFLRNITSLQPQLLRKSAFLELGGFDQRFKYAEVTELFLRLLCKFSVDAISFSSDAIYNYSYRNSGSWSQSRAELFQFRKMALESYIRCLGLDLRIEYSHRSAETGFQCYKVSSRKGT